MENVPNTVPDIPVTYLSWYEKYHQLQNQEYTHFSTPNSRSVLSSFASSSSSASTSSSSSSSTAVHRFFPPSVYHHIQTIQKINELGNQTNSLTTSHIFTSIIQDELDKELRKVQRTIVSDASHRGRNNNAGSSNVSSNTLSSSSSTSSSPVVPVLSFQTLVGDLPHITYRRPNTIEYTHIEAFLATLRAEQSGSSTNNNTNSGNSASSSASASASPTHQSDTVIDNNNNSVPINGLKRTYSTVTKDSFPPVPVESTLMSNNNPQPVSSSSISSNNNNNYPVLISERSLPVNNNIMTNNNNPYSTAEKLVSAISGAIFRNSSNHSTNNYNHHHHPLPPPLRSSSSSSTTAYDNSSSVNNNNNAVVPINSFKNARTGQIDAVKIEDTDDNMYDNTSVSNNLPTTKKRIGGGLQNPRKTFQPPRAMNDNYNNSSTNLSSSSSTTMNKPSNGSTGTNGSSSSSAASSHSTTDPSVPAGPNGRYSILQMYGKDAVNPRPLPDHLQGVDLPLADEMASLVYTGDTITFDDIAGLEHVKRLIYQAAVYPIQGAHLLRGSKLLEMPKGILLFGPPGTGKTLLAKAAASRLGATFFCISASSIGSKWHGESEKMVKALFAAATEYQPSILFVDEADSLLTVRRDNDDAVTGKVKTQFLIEMDGANRKGDSQVIVMAATNRPDLLDEAVRRRFARRILIPLPDIESRLALINHALSTHKGPVDVPDTIRKEIASATEGYSSADVEKICQAAANRAFQRWIRERRSMALQDASPLPNETDNTNAAEIIALQTAQSIEEMCPIVPKDLRKGLAQLRPSVGPDDVKRHEMFNTQYGWNGEKDESSSDEDDNGYYPSNYGENNGEKLSSSSSSSSTTIVASSSSGWKSNL